MSFCTNTQYGSMSCCGMAVPWTCGEVKTIKNTSVKDILLKSIPTALSLDQSRENQIYLEWKEHMKPLNYFPADISRFAQLIYLVHLSDHQSPYSESDCAIFERSNKTDHYTKRWLRCAIIATIAFGVASVILNYKVETTLATSIIIALGVVGGIISWVSTGSNPDFKSDTANERQDRLTQFPETFMQISRSLIQLNLTHPTLAKKLASDLDLKKINNKMLDYDPKAKCEMDLIINDLKSLEAAKNFVLGLPLSDRTPVQFETYIHYLSHSTNQSLCSSPFQCDEIKRDECTIEIIEEN